MADAADAKRDGAGGAAAAAAKSAAKQREDAAADSAAAAQARLAAGKVPVSVSELPQLPPHLAAMQQDVLMAGSWKQQQLPAKREEPASPRATDVDAAFLEDASRRRTSDEAPPPPQEPPMKTATPPPSPPPLPPGPEEAQQPPKLADVAAAMQQQGAPQPDVVGPAMCYGAAQDKGPKRPNQEDRFTIIPDFRAELPPEARRHIDTLRCSYAGVFDGHASALAADIAAQRMYQLLATELGDVANTEGGLDGKAIKHALRRTFENMDAEIIAAEKAALPPNAAHAGTTASVALQLGLDLYVADVGDSSVVLDRGSTPLKMSREHKPEDTEERRRIKKHGGRVIKHGHRVVDPSGRVSVNMTRALGDPEFKEPQKLLTPEPSIRHTLLRQHDKALILASDGVWDWLPMADAVGIAEAVLQAPEKKQVEKLDELAAELDAATAVGPDKDMAAAVERAAAALVAAALALGSTDNVTAVVGALRRA